MLDLLLSTPTMFDGRERWHDRAVGVEAGRISWIGERGAAPEAATIDRVRPAR